MMLHFQRALLVVGLMVLASPVTAAGTTVTTLTTTTYVDLGAAPVSVQAKSGVAQVLVSDTLPSVAAVGNALQPGPPVTFNPADAGSHVWAATLGGSTVVAYAPVYSSGVASSVTQGTSPWVVSGTVTPSNTSAAPLYVADAPYSYTALGCQQITSLASAAPFASVPTGAKLATVTPEVQPGRYRDDGTAPTASIGPLLYPGLVWSYSGPLASIQFIQTAASATIAVCFYK
jgi:hypothetical protein